MSIRIAAVIVLMVLASAGCGRAIPGAGLEVSPPDAASTAMTNFRPFEGTRSTTGTPPEAGAGPFTEGACRPGS